MGFLVARCDLLIVSSTQVDHWNRNSKVALLFLAMNIAIGLYLELVFQTKTCNSEACAPFIAV